MRLLALAVAAAALQAPPKTHRTSRLAATQQQLDVGCWMLLVPELNALPGRHAYDQTEFLNTDEILDRVESIDEAAVLSTCDRYCVFVATKKNLTEALREALALLLLLGEAELLEELGLFQELGLFSCCSFLGAFF